MSLGLTSSARGFAYLHEGEEEEVLFEPEELREQTSEKDGRERQSSSNSINKNFFSKEKVAIGKVINFRFSRQLSRRLTALIEKEFVQRASVKSNQIRSFDSRAFKIKNPDSDRKNPPINSGTEEDYIASMESSVEGVGINKKIHQQLGEVVSHTEMLFERTFMHDPLKLAHIYSSKSSTVKVIKPVKV